MKVSGPCDAVTTRAAQPARDRLDRHDNRTYPGVGKRAQRQGGLYALHRSLSVRRDHVGRECGPDRHQRLCRVRRLCQRLSHRRRQIRTDVPRIATPMHRNGRWRWMETPEGVSLQNLGPVELQPESLQPDVGEVSPGQQTDVIHAKIAQDLRADADLPPLGFACLLVRLLV